MKRPTLAQRKAIEMIFDKKVRPAKHISFTKTTFARLEAYLKRHFTGHRALSMVVDKAVDEYLDRHERNGEA